MTYLPAETIRKKRDGKEIETGELRNFLTGYMQNQVPDYQMSALLMAILFKGMGERETFDLTDFMMNSGQLMKPASPRPRADKHSTGGVGDKTSLIIGPIVAAAGVDVPMISGRGLGHTGGTLDKLESIPGFNTRLSIEAAEAQIARSGLCFLGQTGEICPADKRLYALRDVTGTVESVPLISASIMSKKLAEQLNALVLDIKFGSGAFMKTLEQARHLAQSLIRVGNFAGVKVTALLTSMNQPLGRFAGNALEVQECLEILQDPTNNSCRLSCETKDLSLELSAWMILLAGRESNLEQARTLARKTLESGAALKKFAEICGLQGGDLAALPTAKLRRLILSPCDGFLRAFDTEQIGYAAVELKAGRRIMTDPIDPSSGIEFHLKLGAELKKGAPLFTLYGNSETDFDEAEKRLRATFQISESQISESAAAEEILIREVITATGASTTEGRMKV